MDKGFSYWGMYVLRFGIWLGIIIFSAMIHEYAHALAATKAGDPTPKLAGRLTLNPIPHLSPLGTVFLIFAGIGWTNPIPINPKFFRNQRSLAWVALAGPLANLVLGIVLFLGFAFILSENMSSRFLIAAIRINFVLTALNLIPLPPLDGARILGAAFPKLLSNITYETAGYILILLAAGGFVASRFF